MRIRIESLGQVDLSDSESLLCLVNHVSEV